MKFSIKVLFLTLLMSNLAYAQTASILPPAKTTFVDQNGKPLTAGTVDFYIPSTTTRKTTWQDAAETIPNANPVVLDAAGRALILGSGSYRQIVKDRLGNIIWDQVTSSTGSGSSGSTATGDGDLVGTIKPWAGMTAPNQYAFTYGQEVSRSTYAVLFTAITSTQPVFCTSGSAVLTGLSDTTNFWIGMSVEASCTAAGFTTIISKTSSSVTLAVNANVSTNVNATFFPWGNGNHTTTFNLPDFRGVALAGNNIMGGVSGPYLSATYFGATDPNSAGALGGNQSLALSLAQLPTGITSANTALVPITATTSTSDFVRSPGGANVSVTTGVGAFGSLNSLVLGLTNVSGNIGIGTVAVTSNNTSGSAHSLVQPTRTTNYIIKITPDTNSATASGVTRLGGMTGDIACGSGLTCTGNIVSVGSLAGAITPTSVAINTCTLGTSVLCTNGTSRFGGNLSIGSNAVLPEFNLNIASVFDGTPNDSAALQVASVMYYSAGAGTYTNGWQQFIAPAITSCTNGNLACGGAPVINVTLGGGLRFLNPTIGGTPAPTLTTNEAIHIDLQTAGVNNYAIHTYGVTPSIFETNNFQIGANVAGQSSYLNIVSAGSGNGVGAYVEFQQGAAAVNFIGGHSGIFGGTYNSNLVVTSLAGILELAPNSGGVFTQSKVTTINTDGSICNGCATAFGAGSIRATGGFGYATGASVGGSVTQLTSRTTAVTLNNLSGKITLFSAAGSGTVACFTVNNTAVAVTDTISTTQVSGTDSYPSFARNIVAGTSFQFCQSDFTGTTVESPSFQYNIIKGTIN